MNPPPTPPRTGVSAIRGSYLKRLGACKEVEIEMVLYVTHQISNCSGKELVLKSLPRAVRRFGDLEVSFELRKNDLGNSSLTSPGRTIRRVNYDLKRDLIKYKNETRITHCSKRGV